ncbi:SpoIIE family protein phosphatase [Streptomyces lydicus]|uniref:SpoIIE family protein phosphatase n=1 Tax=Streptomyces lydicus TaxID=47763 RepID=UPI00342E6D5F
MNGTPIDYAAVFRVLPGGLLLLSPEFVILDVNETLLHRAGRDRRQVIGRYLFDVFPDNPADPDASGMRNLLASLERVVATGERDTMALQRYDIEAPGRPGVFAERYWSPVNAPVLDAAGRVQLVVHRVEDVTEIVRAGARAHGDRERMAAELYARAQELQEVNDRLRASHARERQVVLALQEAMLPRPRPGEVLGIYARSVEGAESTTAAQAIIDWTTHTIAYSSAGHPPPALLHPDGTVELLDGATDPPLGARPEHVDRPEARVPFTDDAVLVLYTDGLIERRREDIDVGLARLAGSLARHRGADAETLADALLAELLPPGGATDDTALVVIRL